jgi:hypothetical protein
MDKIKGTEGQTIQWTKEKGRKDRQYNGQKKRDGRTNNTMEKIKGTEGQTTTQKTEDRALRILLKTEGNLLNDTNII